MPVGDVLDLRGPLQSKEGSKSSKKSSGRSSKSPHLGHSSESKKELDMASIKPPDQNQEAKVVYNHREASWLNDVDVIPIAPYVEDNINPNNQRKAKWKWVPIRSSSRARSLERIDDDLTLYHWIDTSREEEAGDYKFSCFDKRAWILRYTDEEYETYLQHPEWTRHETDVLFKLCEEYDLRFVVVHDRYSQALESMSKLDSSQSDTDQLAPTASSREYFTASGSSDKMNSAPKEALPYTDKDSNGEDSSNHIKEQNGLERADRDRSENHTASAQNSSFRSNGDDPENDGDGNNADDGSNDYENREREPNRDRTVEELKDRFYSIQRALLKIRNGMDPDLKKHPMIQHEYDMEYESHRRLQLDLLQQRTHSQEMKIALTVLQARRLNKRIKMIKRSLSEKNGIHIRGPQDKSSSVVTLKRNFYKSRVSHHDEVSVPPPPIRKAMIKRINKFNSSKSTVDKLASDMFGEMEEDREIKLAPIPEKVIAKKIIPELKPGVVLRSAQIAMPLNLTGRTLKNMENELASLNLHLKKQNPFSVPTSEVYKLYNQLRTDIMTLHNMRRHIAKKEAEREQIKVMLRAHNKGGPASEKRKLDSSGSGSFKRRKTLKTINQSVKSSIFRK